MSIRCIEARRKDSLLCKIPTNTKEELGQVFMLTLIRIAVFVVCS